MGTVLYLLHQHFLLVIVLESTWGIRRKFAQNYIDIHLFIFTTNVINELDRRPNNNLLWANMTVIYESDFYRYYT